MSMDSIRSLLVKIGDKYYYDNPSNKYTIIYRDENSINDYELEVTKITPDYIYGIGGLVKYKKIRIVGVII